MSVRQGEHLSELLRASGAHWNRSFDGEAVVVDEGALPTRVLTGGLRITLLSPTRRRLAVLASKWGKDREKYGPKPWPRRKSETVQASGQAAAAPEESQELEDDDPDEEELLELERGVRPPAPRDIERLAEKLGPEGNAPANGASIAFLAEREGRSVLLPADAYPSDLELSIRRLLDERDLGRLPLDAFVVPRGGSRRHLTVSLLELLECRRYLFSASGARYRLPAAETVAAILRHGRPAPHTPLELHFCYRSKESHVWSLPELQTELNYTAFYPEPGSAGLRIDMG